ncbi:MAG: hypothetical protein ABI693_17015 [Bryobacteraceae bacterium]
MRLSADLNPTQRYAIRLYLAEFDFNNGTAKYRLYFDNLDSTDTVDNFPAATLLDGAVAQVTLVGDDAMVYISVGSFGARGPVVVVPQWRTAVQWYR